MRGSNPAKLAHVHFSIAIASALGDLDPPTRHAFLLHLDAHIGRVISHSLSGPAHAHTRERLRTLWDDLEDAITLLDAFAAQRRGSQSTTD